MSTFEVPIVRIRAIEPIDGADAIELAVVGDYRSVVRKGQYEVGQLAAYIPEQSILPNELISALGLEGKLAGPEKNRVKAVKLRGTLSQGILYPVDAGEDCGGPFTSVPSVEDNIGVMLPVAEGDDVASAFGITKYQPIVPTHMSGEVYSAGQHLTVAYDIENVKKYPDIIVPGEDVVFTEKLHGTFCGVGVLPRKDHDDMHFQREFVIFSKGLGADGLCFKDISVAPANANNVYIRTLTEAGILDALRAYRIQSENDKGFEEPLFILGEVYGAVQDLTYGLTGTRFRMFDAVQGYRGNQRYIDYGDRMDLAMRLMIDVVPLLYVGPYSKEVMLEHTSGKTVITDDDQIREGIVMVPVTERTDPQIGRVILKSVSEAYLLRKNKNATEYQ